MNLLQRMLAQNSMPPALPRGGGAGSDIADWADSPERLALVWIVGGALLIGVIVLLIKMKNDKD